MQILVGQIFEQRLLINSDLINMKKYRKILRKRQISSGGYDLALMLKKKSPHVLLYYVDILNVYDCM